MNIVRRIGGFRLLSRGGGGLYFTTRHLASRRTDSWQQMHYSQREDCIALVSGQWRTDWHGLSVWSRLCGRLISTWHSARRLLTCETELCVPHVKQMYNQQLVHRKNRKHCYMFQLLSIAIFRKCLYFNTYTALFLQLCLVDGASYKVS